MVSARSVLVSLIVKVHPASLHGPEMPVAAALRHPVCRLGTFRCTGARDFSIGFRAAVTVKLPGIADFLNFIEIQFSDQQLILVAAGLLNDFPARVAEIALAVEFADLPGMLGADAVDGRDEISVSNRVRWLLEFPKIFGEAGDSGRRVIDDFRAVEAEDSRAFREVAVVADVHADTGITSLEDRVAGVSRREVKLFPETRMAMRNVVLAVFAEIAAVGVDDCGGVEVDAGHLDLVHWDDEHHLMFFRELLHQRDRGAVRDAFGQFIPASLLFGAEVGAVEKLLQAEDLHLFLCGIGDQALVLGDHFLFDFGERELFRRPLTLGLNQAAANDTGHATPPGKRRRRVYPARGCPTRHGRSLKTFHRLERASREALVAAENVRVVKARGSTQPYAEQERARGHR